MAPLAIADMDIIDVGVGLQSEDEADQVRSGQQHRDCVHQRPEKKKKKKGFKLENRFEHQTPAD